MRAGVQNAMNDDPLSILAESLDPLFWPPSRLGAASGWYAHVPFAHWLVCNIKPQLVVELGTHNGVSYAAFCEAVARSRLSTACFAVDTWVGDEHAGFYGKEVYAELLRFNKDRYASFSELLRTTFDAAAPHFADDSIDLLHIDGLHTYEAVEHDFETWLPKLSDRAVVLLHDTNVRAGSFGVWRVFLELKQRWPAFEFLHGHGLGVVAVGSGVPAVVTDLCALGEASINSVRNRFAIIGEYWAYRAGMLPHAQSQEFAETVNTLMLALKEERARADGLAAEIEQLRSELRGSKEV
jgi:O-antigen biosynthesis protein